MTEEENISSRKRKVDEIETAQSLSQNASSKDTSSFNNIIPSETKVEDNAKNVSQSLSTTAFSSGKLRLYHKVCSRVIHQLLY